MARPINSARLSSCLNSRLLFHNPGMGPMISNILSWDDEIPEKAGFIIGAGHFGTRAANLLIPKWTGPLYAIDVDEKNLVQLTNWPSNELYPCWSPDGKTISFRSDRDGNADIWSMASNGSAITPLVRHPAEEVWNCWSPNGRWLYFVSNRSGQYNIWRIPASGGPAEAVTTFQDPAFG